MNNHPWDILVNQENNRYKQLWMMGLALTLPMIILSGPLAGYLIGEYVLVRGFGLPQAVIPILLIVGMIGSALQAIKIITELKSRTK